MTIVRLSYVAMLVFCLAGTLPLVWLLKLRVFRRPARLAAAVVLGAAPFVAWDVWATRVGQWRFDPHQTLPWKVAGLPLEEFGFFVVIPLASILTYETIRTNAHKQASPADSDRASEDVS